MKDLKGTLIGLLLLVAVMALLWFSEKPKDTFPPESTIKPSVIQ